MGFKKIIASDELLNKSIDFTEFEDFEKFAKKSENADYLFITNLTMFDENKKPIEVSELKLVFDVISKTFFSYQKDLVPKEEIDRLLAISNASDDDNDDEPIIIEDEINRLGISKEEIVNVLKEYIQANSCSGPFFINEHKFKIFLIKNINKLKTLANKNDYELSTYFEELLNEPNLVELMGLYKEEEFKKKDELYNLIANELKDNQDYLSAKADVKKSIIVEQLYKHKIYDTLVKDIMLIKGKIDVLNSGLN